MTEGQRVSPEDAVKFVAKKLRPIVLATACPTCQAKRGFPCWNQFSFTWEARDTYRGENTKKRKRRPVYQNYVHAARRVAHAAEQSIPKPRKKP